VRLLNDQDFYSGETVSLRVLVTHREGSLEKAVGTATVSVKVLGTSFRPLILSARTDLEGTAVVAASIPQFSTGRAAILIRAVTAGESVEIRRVIRPGA
jgi:hypothetical protein